VNAKVCEWIPRLAVHFSAALAKVLVKIPGLRWVMVRGSGVFGKFLPNSGLPSLARCWSMVLAAVDPARGERR